MTYTEAIDFLYNSLPMFQSIGPHAYKPGLDTTRKLSAAFGNPHTAFPSVHIAGTNGKGSTASLIAAVYTSAGYRTGLYTSPHLTDFRERIRIDGKMISQLEVIDFIERYKALNLEMSPSFFELTTIMAFESFMRHGVDIAVIETGLGGRLDSTNIINPELSIITNISKDHTALLGDSLEEIASEKAGIIKPRTPVIIGESGSQEIKNVFTKIARNLNSPITFADATPPFSSFSKADGHLTYHTEIFGDISCDLIGDCQPRNAATALTAILTLEKRFPASTQAVKRGFANVQELSGLAGRWMTVRKNPTVICDTGHNPGGWHYLSKRLAEFNPEELTMIIGFVSDKDVSSILKMMPPRARYIFTSPSVKRGMPAEELASKAAEVGLSGITRSSVEDAYGDALATSSSIHTIFVGGSTFVVADLLTSLKKHE